MARCALELSIARHLLLKMKGSSLFVVACLLVLGIFAPVYPQAATPAGAEITNIASSTFDTGLPGLEALRRVESNPVVTMVEGDRCFLAPTLSVSPSGTISPADLLVYTVVVTNDNGLPLTSVVVRMPLDSGLLPPVSYSSGSLTTRNGAATAVTAIYDLPSHTVTWTMSGIAPGDSLEFQMSSRARSGLPADTMIDEFAEVSSAVCPDPVETNLVSVDVVPSILEITKSTNRTSVTIGDSVLYTLMASHGGSVLNLDNSQVVDRLPPALRYIQGTTTVDGIPAPDPLIDPSGRTLIFDLGSLRPGDGHTLRYGAVVVAGAARGEAINRAHFEALTPAGFLMASEPATAAVRILPGPFRREAHLVGRVFIDDDRDGIPDEGEPGVPGVLVTMEDGRGALSDISGRWNITGVAPGLHVIRLDPATLPGSLGPLIGGAQWIGDASTRFVEARASTLVVADLPVGPALSPRCTITADTAIYILPLAIFQDQRGRYDDAATRHVDSLVRHMGDAGVSTTTPPAVYCGDDSIRRRMARDISSALGKTLDRRSVTPVSEATVSFEKLLRTIEDEPKIIAPKDGELAERSRIDVDIVVPTNSNMQLLVNGDLVPDHRIGTRSELPSRDLAALRYVGVELRSGVNVLELRSSTSDGTPSSIVRVHMPGEPVKLVASAEDGHWVADGVTAPILVIEALDGYGGRSMSRHVLTVDIDGATIADEDLDLERPGWQVRLRGGAAEVALVPLTAPGRVRVHVATDIMEHEAEIEVRTGGGGWRVTGLAEANLVGDAGVEGDGGAAPGLGDPLTESGGRLALFARGPLGENTQLTLAVDTDRDRDRDRLTTDFEPDLFYPVVGDESTAVDEATAQGKLFARIDGSDGYVQWGDFSTAFSRTELSRYDRRMTGAKGSVRARGFSFDGFASSSDQLVVRDVFEADNTSGPFLLRTNPVIVRSETVIVEVRDRYRTTEVLSREIKRRDLDYDLDPVAGTILFRAPIAAFDAELNPRRVIVLYETRGGGNDQWTGGGRIAWRGSREIEIGSTAVVEERSGDNYSLLGLDLHWRPTSGTQVHAEVASSNGGEQSTAYRFVVAGTPRHELRWELGLEEIPREFDNPTLLAAPEIGTRRMRGQLEWQPNDRWRVKAEGYTQEDDGAGIERTVIGLETERRSGPVTVLTGLRHVATETGVAGASDSTLAKAGLRGRISERWSAELYREQALGNETAPGFPTRTAAGVGFDVRPDTKLFLRQEFESGDGPDRDRTILGVESRIGPNTRALMNYSLNGGIDGDALRALAGVETVLPLDERRSVQFSAGRLQTTSGDTRGDYTTLGAGFEFRTGSKLLSTRYELRMGELDDRHLLTASGAFKPSEPWTVFVRERLFVDDANNRSTAWRGEGLFGAAFRPRVGRWQFLARLDHEIGSGIPGNAAGIQPGTAPTEPSSSLSTPLPTPATAGLGTEPGRALPATDAISLSIATGFRPSAHHRFATSVILRRVGADRTLGFPSTLGRLASLHYTADVHRRWTIGMSLREFAELRSSTRDHGAGVELGFLAFRNMWITAGYNLVGFDDGGFAAVERTERGAFLSLRFKFDERSLAQLGDLRLDR